MTKNTYEDIGYGKPDKKPPYQDLTKLNAPKRAIESSPLLKEYMLLEKKKKDERTLQTTLAESNRQEIPDTCGEEKVSG